MWQDPIGIILLLNIVLVLPYLPWGVELEVDTVSLHEMSLTGIPVYCDGRFWGYIHVP